MPSTNQLGQETSLYLRQHAANPVDWNPWGPSALSRSQSEQKPIFLSIGYSACHWCHVMEHESFMDLEVAQFLNENFINIKVDREERPDIDHIYMSAVVALTGHGGWPMSLFLTPALQPFYAGTYFPRHDRGGMPSFRRVLDAVHNAWLTKKDQIVEQAQSITAALAEQTQIDPTNESVLSADLLLNAKRVLERSYDHQYGGFGRAPKFPHPLDLRMLLRVHHRFGDEEALSLVTNTLDHMSRGGIYDQLAGGFHRYSTDQRWLAPHFEKMLYDNALLVPVYLEAFQITGETAFRRIAHETLAWVEREMTSPGGAFYSTTDADSEGQEGKFFVWTQPEIEHALGQDADFVLEIFDVTPHGNWEGHTILTRPKTDAQEARLRSISEEAFRIRLEEMKTVLLAHREKRIKPGRDEKILAAWNGLMISAFAQASLVLGKPEYAQRARAAANFILNKMRQPDGRLFRTSLETGPAKLNAYLEDYAFLIDGLNHLYQATFQDSWLVAARELARIMIDQFWDQEHGGFFFTGHDHEQLITRDRQPHDNAVPSGNSMAVTALLHLGRLTGNQEDVDRAEQTLKLFAQGMTTQSPAYGQMLVALDDYLGPIEEFALFAPTEKEMADVRHTLFSSYRPRKVIAGGSTKPDLVPWLTNRSALNNQCTLYRCQNQTCDQPWVGIKQIKEKLSPTPAGAQLAEPRP